jgi:hypothetical protein
VALTTIPASGTEKPTEEVPAAPRRPGFPPAEQPPAVV